MRTLTLEEAANMLKVSPRSLGDKRYRLRLPLPARKVGRKVIFIESDILKLLERNIEPIPGEERR